MAIEAQCSQCQRILRVAAEDAGKMAICPVCGASTQMPGAGPAEPRNWRLRTPENQVFGPISKSELDSWHQQGRIDEHCQLSDDGAIWRPAAEIYPDLAPIIAVVEPTPAPVERIMNAPSGYLQPHRGGLVMTMGVLSWVTCPMFSVLAWSLGVSDVREIRSGRMDPTGLPETQAGMVLGMINAILWMVTGLIALCIVGFVVASR